MNPETGIYEMIRDDAQISAIVGGRIYPATVPANVVTPFILTMQMSEDEQMTKDGPIPNGWTFQVASIGKNNSESRTLSRLIKKALNWKTKALETGETIRVIFEDESDASFDDEQQYFQIVQDYRARKTL